LLAEYQIFLAFARIRVYAALAETVHCTLPASTERRKKI
jgi:hypothetical protein